MSENSPGSRAVAAFDIADVFLIEASCRVARDFNSQAQFPEILSQHLFQTESGALHQQRAMLQTGATFHVIRYFVSATLRLLKPGIVPDKPDLGTDDWLGEVHAKIAVDYFCPAGFEK